MSNVQRTVYVLLYYTCACVTWASVNQIKARVCTPGTTSININTKTNITGYIYKEISDLSQHQVSLVFRKNLGEIGIFRTVLESSFQEDYKALPHVWFDEVLAELIPKTFLWFQFYLFKIYKIYFWEIYLHWVTIVSDLSNSF